MPEATTVRHPFLAAFGELERDLARRGPKWLRDARREGANRFGELGFPSAGQEEWRGTNVSAIAALPLRPPTPGTTRLAAIPGPASALLGGPRSVFVDGRFSAEMSTLPALPEGVRAGSLAEAIDEDPDRWKSALLRHRPGSSGPFRALNAALTEDGGFILVPAGTTLDRPIQIVHVSGSGDAPAAVQPRTLIVAEPTSRATIVETWAGMANAVYLTNSVTEIEVGDGARVEHYRVQSESESAYHVSATDLRLGRDSQYAGCSFDLGGKLVRNEVHATLDGEGGHCTLDGLYLTGGDQHVDNRTVIDHAKPNCDSRELYKGILGGRSRSVFNGRIIVRQDAQKIDAKQSNPNLLLTDRARVETRPQLEIYADDVKCTHGATVGRLDEESVFYLRCRGVSEAEARRLMVLAFAGEVVDRISVERLRSDLTRAIADRLSGEGP